MNDEHIATYLYDAEHDDGVYEVYAIYDSWSDRDDRKISFYDVFNKKGICVNEGDPFYSLPSWQDIYDLYYSKITN